MSLTCSDRQLELSRDLPSLGAISYQASYLIESLDQFTEIEYPASTIRLRNVFLSIACSLRDELEKFHNPEDPLVPLGGEASLLKVKSISLAVRKLFALKRYLDASAPARTPPGVQAALHQLAKFAYRTRKDEPLIMVRPQWAYNLTYVAINRILENVLETAQGTFHDDVASRKQLEKVWKTWRAGVLADLSGEELAKKESEIENLLPVRMGILSFAALDTPDSLLSPLLAHELGHFIDLNNKPSPYHQSKNVDIRSRFDEVAIEEIRKAKGFTPKDAKQVLTHLGNVCLRELFADLLATRMMGLSYFLALAEFLKTVVPWSKRLISDDGYPTMPFRLWVVFQQLKLDKADGNLTVFLDHHSTNGRKVFDRGIARRVQRYLCLWEQKFEKENIFGKFESDLDRNEMEVKLVEEAVWAVIDPLRREARKAIPNSERAVLEPSFFERVYRLAKDLVPTVRDETPQSFAEICSAAWTYQILIGDRKEGKQETIVGRRAEYDKSCRLITKAIELIPDEAAAKPNVVTKVTDDPPSAAGAGVLSSVDIRSRIDLDIKEPSRIDVSPFSPKLVKASSLDVRLGNWFSAAKRTRLRSIRIEDTTDEQLLRGIGREEVFVPNGKTFLLHPGDLVLGITLEFLALPGDMMGFVEGKSSLGRLGLIVATAAQVAPGFHGVVVLELANAGTIPLELKPGAPIAQIVFQTLARPVPKTDAYHDRYYCQIKP